MNNNDILIASRLLKSALTASEPLDDPAYFELGRRSFEGDNRRLQILNGQVVPDPPSRWETALRALAGAGIGGVTGNMFGRMSDDPDLQLLSTLVGAGVGGALGQRGSHLPKARQQQAAADYLRHLHSLKYQQEEQ